MAQYTQANRPFQVTTPLSPDTLLPVEFSGQEAISQLFSFELDLIAENDKEIAFDKLLGKPVSATLNLPGGGTRTFHGICNRFSQGGRDRVFTAYRLHMVPGLWLLTRRAQSRIFQQLSVPDILKKVLTGLDVAWQIQGTFHPRDYCAQYRETDFNFASRLMEEEGIYYFFKHTPEGHKMVVANTPQSHPDLPGQSKIIYQQFTGSGGEDEDQVSDWRKVQEVRSGKYTLWDHCFELPHDHLAADRDILGSVQAGTVSHQLKVGSNDHLEIYDYPGEFAQRFDGISPGGGDRAADLKQIFEDNQRTVRIRMLQETVPGLIIQGSSNCGRFETGHKFSLTRHFNADGPYVLTSVQHHVRTASGHYRSSDGGHFHYSNNFTCIPFAQPFVPQRSTPKPFVQGSQTAVVVGPAGEEIFCDKYGRVKVQFHWDREGKNNADSSCWARVGSLWAGKQWGMIHIPRIGQEVIVDFLEGDPDQPIITGSVYNAKMMPPYKLPDNRTQSGIKTRSSLKGDEENFNEIRFEDKKGAEQLFIHAEKNQDIEVENDETHAVGRDRKKTIARDETNNIGHDRKESVQHDENIKIGNNRSEQVQKDETIVIGQNRTENVGKNEEITIAEKRTESVGKSEEVSIGENRQHSIAKNDQLTVGKELFIEAGDQITLKTGDASITMKKNGEIQIQGKDISLIGSGKINAKADSDVSVKGSNVKIN
jgi:type VI secretion system secreted protein VgrG